MDLSRFKIPEKSKITNKRQEIVKQFLDRLNSERGREFKPLTAARVGVLLAQTGMTTDQLYVFFAELKQSKHFSKSFWWRINPNNYK